MRKVYRVLAFVVAALVVVQAAAITYAMFGLAHWIEGGGTLDAAAFESEPNFAGVVGFVVHAMNGMMVIPVVALVLLICSFFAHTPGAVRWALIVLVTTVVQIGLGVAAHSVPQLGILHGIVALVLFGAAVMAAMTAKAKPVPVATDSAPTVAATT